MTPDSKLGEYWEHSGCKNVREFRRMNNRIREKLLSLKIWDEEEDGTGKIRKRSINGADFSLYAERRILLSKSQGRIQGRPVFIHLPLWQRLMCVGETEKKTVSVLKVLIVPFYLCAFAHTIPSAWTFSPFFPFIPGFLSFSTVDILGWITLSCGGLSCAL